MNRLRHAILSPLLILWLFPAPTLWAAAFSHGDPTPAEQAHLEAINRARANPLAEAARLGIDLLEGVPEGEISDQPSPPLVCDALLLQAARSHAADMIANDYASHFSPDGDGPLERVTAAGYEYAALGENFAFRAATASLDEAATSQWLHDRLFIDENYPDRSHRVTLLAPEYRAAGPGLASGEFQGFPHGIVVVTDFGRDIEDRAFLLGVVHDDADGDAFYDAGEGVGDVTVSASQDDEVKAVTLTASAGGYGIPLDPGEYVVTATLPDGRTARKTVELIGDNVKLDFRESEFAATEPEPVETFTLWFPHADTSDGWGTELALLNLTTAAVAGTLRAMDDDGAVLASLPVVISSEGRTALNVGTAFPVSGIGYLTFESESRDVAGYLKFHQNGKFRVGLAASNRPAQSGELPVPHIDTGREWWTGLALVNTGTELLDLAVVFNTGDVRSVTLGPGAHTAFTVAELLGPGRTDVTSAVIHNATGIVGLTLFGDDRRLSGVPLTDHIGTRLLYPHVDMTAQWWTGIVVYNPSDASVGLTVTPHDASGAALSPLERSLAAGGRMAVTATDLGLPASTAWMSVDATGPVTGFELFGTTDLQELAGVAVGGSGSGSGSMTGVFPEIASDGWTGIALLNTGASATTVTLRAMTDAGSTVAQTSVPLASLQKRAALPGDLFSTGLAGATHIRFSASQNITGFQLNGSGDGGSLDALPALTP